jgi:hypothetical protein
MNMAKVKNVVLLLLVMLNLALFGLIQAENGRFRLSAAQDTAIRKLFEMYGFEIDAAIPKNFRPMRGLYVLPFQHDMDAHAQRFFPGETPEAEEWLGSLTLRVGESSLTLENNVLRYLNHSGYATEAFLERGFGDAEAERELADGFVKRIVPPELNFVFDYSTDWLDFDEVLTAFIYRGYYGDRLIQNNWIRVLVNENGITRVTCHFTSVPQRFSSHPREIYSADEALFSALQRLVHRHRDNDVRVLGVDVAYFMVTNPTDTEFYTKAIPCYKIMVEINGMIDIYWVDAYTLALEWGLS